MSIKSIISAQYGLGVHRQTTRFKRLKLQLSSAKNRTLFLERLRHHRLIPKFLKNRCPIKSHCASKLTTNYQSALLRECLTLARGKLHRASKSIAKIDASLKLHLSTEHYDLITRITNQSYEKDFERRKTKLKEKFEKILGTQRPPLQPPQRPTTIKNPVLQLQPQPLPAEAIEVLKLGPKFALTPKDIPKMDIITETEKAALQLERDGKRDKAADLRHNVTNILLHAKAPKSNLTSQQKRGLNFLKKSKDISVTPFDKGQGFVTLETSKMIQKAEAEFKNTSLDTPNETTTYEGKFNASYASSTKMAKLTTKPTRSATLPGQSLLPPRSLSKLTSLQTRRA